MEDMQTFAHRVEESLATKRDRLDRAELLKLKESFKIFQSSFQSIRTILYKKGILHEDPYKFDLKISEVGTPPETPFAESEKIEKMCVRVSQFESYLDFLNNYYQFSTDFLTMGRIRRLLALTKYFNFNQFTETSTQPNTRALAELVGTIKKGSDQFSTGLIADAINQLDKTSKDIVAVLKELAAYHKERYKLELRQLVMPRLNLDPAAVVAHREEAVHQVKHKFAEIAGDRPFYPELVEELLLEDYFPEGAALREEVLKRLAVKEEKRPALNSERTFRTILLEGARALAGAALSLEDAISKLRENSAVFEAGDHTLAARLRRMLRKIFFPDDNGLVYRIEVIDPSTNQRVPQDVDLVQFLDETGKRASLIASLGQRGTSPTRRMEDMPEDQAYKFLQRNIEEIQKTLRILAGFDEFFKEETKKEDRPKIKGIMVELSTVKGAVIKANQKKHEYVAQREELEQMRRLGIRDQAP